MSTPAPAEKPKRTRTKSTAGPRERYKRRYDETVLFCKVSIGILESMIPPVSPDARVVSLEESRIIGEIRAFRKVLAQLGASEKE